MTVFIIATIALGIAANTTVFTILNTFLLNPLPVRNAGELVAVTSADTGRQMNSGTLLPISYLNLRDIATRNTSFQAFAGYTSPTTMTLSEAAGPRRMFAEIVTGDYFDTLGVRPAAGRFFDLGRTGAEVVMSYACWRVRFGGAPDIIGRMLRIDNVNFTVAGIALRGFMGVNAVFGPDIWLTAETARELLRGEPGNSLKQRATALFHGVGRLKPGVSLAQADANLRQ